MSTGRGKPSSSNAADAASEPLLTSSDLFGDLVDAPPPAAAPRAGARGPIRIQVSESAPQPPANPLQTAAAELEGALDRLIGPAEPAPPAEVAPPAPQPPEPLDLRFERAGERTDPHLVIAPSLPPDPEARPADAAPLRIDAGTNALAAVLPQGTDLDLSGGSDPRAPLPMPDLGLGSAERRETPTARLLAEPPPHAARPASPRGEAVAFGDFGPYRLLERVAFGGMAEVFKAKRSGVEGFEKVVALKRILPHLSDNKEFVDMFVDEAKMVAGLSHPNIVQIFDLGRISHSYYIAMEYVHGRDLRTIQKRERDKGLRMPLDLGLRVISQVCAALEYAHRKKDERGRAMELVHRDVSPQNILLSFEGEVKLVDFGIAKAATKASNTERGALRGKLLYMSPEQAWGRPIDRRSDLFSLGIVLYEMVTETKPFVSAGTELTILELVRQCQITPPREINPRVPEALERVIMKALAREPDERYQDAGQMQRGLERILRERPPVTARDLARFLELLFERSEREGRGTDGSEASEDGPGTGPASGSNRVPASETNH